jgi:alpha-galactosidase
MHIRFKNLFLLLLVMAVVPSQASAAPSERPVKVYILAGQSNMQGKGGIEGDGGNTLRSLVEDAPSEAFKQLIDDKGEWVVRDDVWIHYDLHPWQGLRHGSLKPGYGSNSGQIGPELGFGQVVGDATEGQVLLIKVAWGGKSLCHDFLSPSIGKYSGSPALGEAGYYYTRLVEVVNLVTANIETFFPDYKGQGVELAGFGWHQGWNDQYGEGNAENYERNMEAFIRDIRSVEHGVGVPGLPFVIATSGMIDAESPIVKGQLAMADTQAYPAFAGNVAVVDTHRPYGPNNMGFKFDKNGQPTDKVGYHWNSSARSYFNIGRAIATEMQKLKEPAPPARLAASAKADGVRLNWQLGSETPKSVTLRRNGKCLDIDLKPTQTEWMDTGVLPGLNEYELIINMPSGEQKLTAACDTSATNLTGYRSLNGVTLRWQGLGKYDGFIVKRDGKVIADALAADARSFEDKSAPTTDEVTYSVEPTTGKVTPATLTMNLAGGVAGGALVYEPFDYPADADEPQSLLGRSGAVGTKGDYVTLDETPKHLPMIAVGGLSHGDLPVAGNSAHGHHWSKGCAIELDGGLKKAGLLDDGAEMWIGFLFHTHQRGKGIDVSLQSADAKEAIGFNHKGVTESYVYENGQEKKRLFVKGMKPNTTYLFVAKMVWGKDGEPDQWIPYFVPDDLKLPEKHGRLFTEPFNIDQNKLTRLVLKGGDASNVDEIRIGPTFESVVGRSAK